MDVKGMVAVIGGGPAGLMAAEVLAAAGVPVTVFDAMPSVGRKFLMAGKGGMNITHSEALADFIGRYGKRSPQLAPLVEAFAPETLRAWIHGLGVETFVGTSGRVFPTEMKAAPLMRAWLHRLREAGVRFQVRHRWLGWDADGALRFATPTGEVVCQPSATVLALGGGSWARLGSDGAWVPLLKARGIAVAPLQPANCGFDCAWSEHFRERFAGQPVKSIAATCVDQDGTVRSKRGEALVTASGIEGGLVYALSAFLRDRITAEGQAVLHLDLLPDRSPDWVQAEISRPRGSRSLSSHLQSRLGLAGVKAGLLRECTSRETWADSHALAVAIKALPVVLTTPRPLDEAISSAGGVPFEALDEGLMLKQVPGVFCAGEMLDWEAPTGGYLLTACFATGRRVGEGVARWLERQS
jgi:uncharacterized flavoprotein (TIGR03862 family)